MTFTLEVSICNKIPMPWIYGLYSKNQVLSFLRLNKLDTSRRQRIRLPPCPLVIALVPLKCSSRNLQFPHIYRVPFGFTEEKMPWCPHSFKNKHTSPDLMFQYAFFGEQGGSKGMSHKLIFSSHFIICFPWDEPPLTKLRSSHIATITAIATSHSRKNPLQNWDFFDELPVILHDFPRPYCI